MKREGPESSNVEKDSESRKQDFPSKRLKIRPPESGDDDCGNLVPGVHIKGEDGAKREWSGMESPSHLRGSTPMAPNVAAEQQKSAANDFDGSSHACNICKEIFTSSRDLNYHRRCHPDQPGPSSSHSRASAASEEVEIRIAYDEDERWAKFERLSINNS